MIWTYLVFGAVVGVAFVLVVAAACAIITRDWHDFEVIVPNGLAIVVVLLVVAWLVLVAGSLLGLVSL